MFYEHGYGEKPIILNITEDRLLDRMVGGGGKFVKGVKENLGGDIA